MLKFIYDYGLVSLSPKLSSIINEANFIPPGLISIYRSMFCQLFSYRAPLRLASFPTMRNGWFARSVMHWAC